MGLLLCKNRKAGFEYELLERFDAGIVLQGHEVKSLRNGGGNLSASHVSLKNGEAWLEKFTIALYQKATLKDYDPDRRRKLLLSRKELDLLDKRLKTEGMTLIPLACILKGNYVKVEIVLARGKKNYDKRESIKKRDVERRIRGIRD